jgi:hypothetical protein
MKRNLSKSPMSRVRNPQGRPDWLLAKLLEHSVSMSSDPRVKTSYSIVRHDVEELLLRVLGPRTKNGRKVKELIEKGKAVLREVQAA